MPCLGITLDQGVLSVAQGVFCHTARGFVVMWGFIPSVFQESSEIKCIDSNLKSLSMQIWILYKEKRN